MRTIHSYISNLVLKQQSLDEAFLKDAVMDRLKDDVPEVVAAALRVLEVSEVDHTGCSAPYWPLNMQVTLSC